MTCYLCGHHKNYYPGALTLNHQVHASDSTIGFDWHWMHFRPKKKTMRKKLSPWAHGELTVTTVVTAQGPMITTQSRLGEVTAQSRQGHSSATARSQLSHGKVTAQSRHLQYDHASVTARSQLNHGPGHGSVTAGCDHFGHGELTVSSLWAHSEQSRWPIFFSWEDKTLFKVVHVKQTTLTNRLLHEKMLQIYTVQNTLCTIWNKRKIESLLKLNEVMYITCKQSAQIFFQLLVWSG